MELIIDNKKYIVNQYEIDDKLYQLNYPYILIWSQGLIIDFKKGKIDWKSRSIIKDNDNIFYLSSYRSVDKIEVISNQEINLSNYIYQKEINLIKNYFLFNQNWEHHHKKLIFLWSNRNHNGRYKTCREIYFL